MTPAELRAAMLELHLSAADLARALRLGAEGRRTVCRWLAGDSGIPGPVAVAVEYMLRERDRQAS